MADAGRGAAAPPLCSTAQQQQVVQTWHVKASSQVPERLDRRAVSAYRVFDEVVGRIDQRLSSKEEWGLYACSNPRMRTLTPLLHVQFIWSNLKGSEISGVVETQSAVAACSAQQFAKLAEPM